MKGMRTFGFHQTFTVYMCTHMHAAKLSVENFTRLKKISDIHLILAVIQKTETVSEV